MSVKGKVKRLNREIKSLEYILENSIKRHERDKARYERDKEMLESLIKFFVVNQVGKPAAGGVHIERRYVDKLDSLEVNVNYEPENDAYVITLREVKDENY